jgi:hypothetical protein
MATFLRGDIRVEAAVADDMPMVLGESTCVPTMVPIRDADAPPRIGVWRPPMAGIDWLVLGVDSLAGDGLLMMTTAYAEGLDYLVLSGAFLFFEVGDFFACC